MICHFIDRTLHGKLNQSFPNVRHPRRICPINRLFRRLCLKNLREGQKGYQKISHTINFQLF